VSTNSHHQNDKQDQEQTASNPKEKGNQLESQYMHPEYGVVIGVGIYLSHTPR
jgi:hypothetical protein